MPDPETISIDDHLSQLTDAGELQGNEEVPVLRNGELLRTVFGVDSGVYEVPEGAFRVLATEDEAVADANPQYVWIILDPLPPPDVPTGFSADAVSDTEIMLTWNASADATGYDIRVDGGSPISVGNVTSHLVTGLDPDTSYGFEVRATNAEGESDWSAVVSESTQAEPTAPDAPTGVNAAPGDGEVTVTWTLSSGATGYRVWRNTSDSFAGATQVGSDLGPAIEQYVDDTVTNDTQYWYWVTAFNNIGESDPSDPDDATPTETTGPQVAGTTAKSFNTNTLVLDVPTETQEGDLLVAAIGITRTADIASGGIPSGWTEVRRQDASDGTLANRTRLIVLEKVAGASEPSDYTWQMSDVQNQSQAIMLAVNGVSGRDDDDGNESNSNIAVGPSVDAAAASSLLLMFACGRTTGGVATTFDVPTNMTLEAEQVADGTSRSKTVSVFSELVGSGPTGSRESQMNQSDNWSAITMVVGPE